MLRVIFITSFLTPNGIGKLKKWVNDDDVLLFFEHYVIRVVGDDNYVVSTNMLKMLESLDVDLSADVVIHFQFVFRWLCF
jgi:hypothetical protein